MAHGSSSSYRSGCRCGLCRAAHREHARAYRATKLAAVPAPAPDVTDTPAGAVLAAVERDLAAMPDGPWRATQAATARELARLLDDPTATPQKPSAARQLMTVMAELRAKGSVHKGAGTSPAAASFRRFQQQRGGA